MAALTLTDLDSRPELASAVLGLYRLCPPGSRHLVCGIPERIALPPEAPDLRAVLGVLLAVDGIRPLGAIAICPYSDDQVTLWGPALAAGAHPATVARLLLDEVRRALRDGGWSSMRTLIDVRNREVRTLMQSLGFAAWKDALVLERALAGVGDADPGGVRTAARADHEAVAAVFADAFPDSDHWQANLVRREDEGYRHYLLAEDGVVRAAAAVRGGAPRAWLKLVGVDRRHRRRGLARRLLNGVLAIEARRGTRALGLEVLADNGDALALYQRVGFTRTLTASVLVAPV